MTAKKVDANQSEIVKCLRKLGCHVADTSKVGKGFPDIVVSHLGVTVLVEIKDGAKAPSARKLTPQQVQFHDECQGFIVVVESIDDCVKLFSKIRKKAGYLYR